MRLPQQPPKKGRIEIIPMIDAIFFLLVFFIMTSLTLTQMDAHGSRLPTSRTSTDKPNEKIVVALGRDNTIYIDHDPASEADVRQKVAARVAGNPKTAVLLTADKDADVRRFLRLFDLVKQADAQNVVIATMPTVAKR